MKNLVIISLLCVIAGMFVQSNATHAKLRAENQQWREVASRAAVVYSTDGFAATKAVDPQSLASVIESNYRLIEEMRRSSGAGARMAKN